MRRTASVGQSFLNALPGHDSPDSSARHALRPIAAALGLILAPGVQQAIAADCTWNPATGNWGGSSNWSCGVVPTSAASDRAIITVGRTVTVDSAQSTLNLSNSGQVDVGASLLSLGSGGGTTNTGTINVGSAVTAALQVGASHNIDNTGGVINIASGSVLNQFGSTISGGTIATVGTGKVQAFSNNSNFLNGVTLNGNLDLATNPSSVERITGGLTLGNGTVSIGQGSNFAPQGNQSITGTGNIVFTDGNTSNRFNVEAGNLTLGPGITVRGTTGNIGGQSFVGGAATLTNQGSILADTSGGTISLGVNGGVINQGALGAQNGGTLQLNSAVTQLGAGLIKAENSGVVTQSGVTVSGGLINTSGGGRLVATGSASNFLSGTTLNGVLDMATSFGIERVTGGLTLNGTVNIANGSILAPQGDQTIGGTGTIVFADTNSSNRLNVEAGNLTLGSGITVRGNTGHIGQQSFLGGASTLTNNGTIQADVAGGTITLNVNGGVTNSGTLAALNGGTLLLSSNVNNAVGSQILAGAGSTVVQNGVTLNGVINVAGGGAFRASGSANNFLSAATLNGTLDLASTSAIERVVGGLNLNGTVNIGNNSILAPQGDQTIGGNGTIVFADASVSNRLNVEAGNLTIGAGVTVRGNTGVIGQQAFLGGAATLTNNGVIQADVSGGTITLGVSGAVTNNGTLAARNGGTLLLNSSVNNLAGSQIVADAGSTVTQNGVTLNGTIKVDGAGNFRASGSGNNFLDSANFTGTLDLATGFGIERVTNGLALNGTVNIGNASILAPQGNQTISGTGAIVFADGNASNRLNVEAGNLTIGAGVTVRGTTGVIGQQAFAGGAATLTNNGAIQADVAGGTITLGVSSGVVNNTSLAALNGGTLVLASGVTQNPGGTINAGAGSTVLQSGVTINGGSLNSTGTGRLVATANGNNFINGVTLNGTLDLASSAGIQRVTGGLVLNGTVNIGAAGILAPQGDQTISGSGAIVFADGNASNRLNVEAGNLTIDSGVTVRGKTGVIGQQAFVGGAATLINNGTIRSDDAGVITVAIGGGTLINNGTLAAQNGALNVQTRLTGTGALQVAPTGSMSLANGGNTQSRLDLGGAGAAINVGNGNLTLNSDYTNASAGSGNSFDRRAGITGAGQVVAGGDVMQTITGAGVSNGNTSNATLTIGNVRVGSTTAAEYRINNAGTTGPVLRGAIQTSVNGGNITDSRLSGAGVTAGNYNAGGPGGSTGSLAVNFTAATAGVIAPLTGQAVNLTSNFANIPDQKLNIVIGNGAAAYNTAVGNATPSPTVALGNTRVGGTLGQALTVGNTAAAGAFSEDLNAGFGGSTGHASGSGSVSGVLAGASNGSAMQASLDTSSAGAKSGTVTLNYQTAGAVGGVSNGLGVTNVGSQTISLGGNVYQVAAGQLNTAPLNFGVVQVGQSVSQVLSISNVASGAAGFVEDLNASFGATTGTGSSRISGSGSVSNLIAGGTNSGSMVVNVNTSAAGAINGAIGVNFFSAGAVGGVSNGLGSLAVGSASYGVNGEIQTVGTIVNQAAPIINTPLINLGNVRVGDVSPTGLISVSNQATTAPQAALNATISSAGAIISGGSVSLLNPGATDSSSLQVRMNTASAGAVNGAAIIGLVSDASNQGCTTGCQMDLGSRNVTVSGGVYQVAQPAIGTTVALAAQRVGGTATQGVVITNTSAAPAGYQEGLNVVVAGSVGAASGGGSITNLAQGASSGSAIQVGVDTSAAGAQSGSVTLGLQSNGATSSGLGNLDLPSQVVNVSGSVYAPAVAQLNTASVNFGIVRVGDAVSLQNVSITNAATVAGLNDSLKASITAGSGFSASGTVGGIGAGASNAAGSLTVGLDTSTAGVFSGSALISFLSHNPEMTDLFLGTQGVALSGQVNNLANADFNLRSGIGTLTRSGTQYVLDLGTITRGQSVVEILRLANSVSGSADFLRGAYDLSAADDFSFTGWDDVMVGLAAGGADEDLMLGFTASMLGAVEDTVTFNGSSYNDWDTTGLGQARTLVIRATVVEEATNTVPEPGSLELALLGLLSVTGMAVQRRRMHRRG